MKKSLFIIVYFLFALLNIYPQSIQIGIGAGSTFVTGSEFYTKELDGIIFLQEIPGGKEYTTHLLKGLDFNSEYNLNIKMRLFPENIPFNIYSELSYNSLIGKGEIMISPHPASSYIPPPQKSESICNLFNASAGIEYELFSKGIIPFVSSGIVLSSLGDIKVALMDDNYKSKIIEGGIRYGLEAGLGLYYKFYSSILIGVSSKYTMNNLLSKKETEENIYTVKTNFNIFYVL